MRKITFFTIGFCFLLVTMLMGCKQSNAVQTSEEETAWYENDSALLAQLDAAIADAKQLDASKVSNDLMPVKKGYPGQEWATIDGKDMVLLVTLVDSSRLQRFFGQEGVYRIDRELGTWVTLPADWLRKKDAYEGLDSVAAHMRMIQMYGLSPDCDYNIMVQFYADPSYMFRPAHTPDITTTSAGLEFPAYADTTYTVGETNFREWYRYSFASAYEDDSPLPWTQLGYTYDWHEGANRVGLSEYIVTHQSLIKVKSYESEWSFIQSLFK
ncbi:MAG: hypothetical protein IJ633_08135 [Prevotella sp.]|nr:hypothetical protein [Prevotella sp.]